MKYRKLFLVTALFVFVSQILLYAGGNPENSTDQEIKQKVVDQLVWDTRVDASQITVEVTNGKVILTGTVPSLYSREMAISDTWNVDGVKEIENDIAITPGQAESDLLLAAAVKNTLAADAQVGSSDISVTADGGNIVLKGSVDALWKKLRAEQIASDVKGVLTVTSKIAVVPKDKMFDDAIAADIVAALGRDKNVNVENVTVTVEAGYVTLEGTVDSWTARDAADRAAINTVGVRGLANLLTVKPDESAPQRTDDEIAHSVREEIVWDNRVNASDITVAVQDGVVTLEGTVPSVSEQTAASEDALSIIGVVSVNNELAVTLPEQPVLTDPYLKDRADNILRASSSVHVQDLKIDVVDGVATLNGQVATLWEKQRAEKIVADIEGIIGVVNRIAVVPTGTVLDKTIAEDIVEALERSSDINVSAVTVEVDAGIVTLSGKVSSYSAIQSAVEKAMSTAGVKLVVNNLEIAK